MPSYPLGQISMPSLMVNLMREEVSHLEGLGVPLLLVDGDDNEAEDESQAENDEQQDKAPGRQLQVAFSKNDHCTERHSGHHQRQHAERHHLTWSPISQQVPKVRLPAGTECTRRLLPVHQAQFIRKRLVLLQLAAVLVLQRNFKAAKFSGHLYL